MSGLSIGIAHAAVSEAGHPELIERIIPDPVYGITIKTPCENPHVAVKAVAMAHVAAGHTVVLDYEPGHGHFTCEECGFD